MIEALSPFTRRVLALALLLVAILVILNVVLVPGWELFRSSLARLGDARFQRVRVEAIASRPPPPIGSPVPPTLYISATSRDTATVQLAGALRALASAAGVTVSAVGPLPAEARTPSTIAATISAEGKEKALVQFMARVEQDRPLKRIAVWRISPLANAVGPTASPASLHLDARVTAAWAWR